MSDKTPQAMRADFAALIQEGLAMLPQGTVPGFVKLSMISQVGKQIEKISDAEIEDVITNGVSMCHYAGERLRAMLPDENPMAMRLQIVTPSGR
jgi:hypothetical protein